MTLISSRVLRTRVREKMLVTMKDGAAYTGVLVEVDGKALVLRSAEAVGVGEGRANLPLDGEVILLLPDVSFMQRP